ncbi:alpha/beta hydrolase [Fulvivirga sp. 29W222]|uniref:Alpha/beta hydrolase n=1 Tax=Fulvivirga marina TaxID=2494733 RepID=A0A937FZA9_9BACT|nr:alpha/beta hydrolase [Fulvivirga marina]MBL6447772.1 alpha/beta hydrolase [Fulvivirga marina]
MTNYGFTQTPAKSEAVRVNGKNIYYEVYGEGEPLILLHGYTSSSKAWKSYISDFESNFKVYLVDLTGHGKSDAFKSELSIPSVGEDLNALFAHLELERVKAIGFSYGGDVLYQLALINPQAIESMIVIGSLGSWDVNNHPEWQEYFAYENIAQFEWIRFHHNSEEQIRAILEQFNNYTVRLSDEQLQNISIRTLIMLGDDDAGMPLEEVLRVRKHLPESDLWILPNVSHGVHEGEYKEEFVKRAKKFFAEKTSTEEH